MNELETYLTVAQTAKLLQLSDAGVYNYVNRGLLPCVKIGKTIRFSPSALKKHLDRLQLASLGDAA